MAPSTLMIRARSRREAMDWGLVLASQGIDATIVKGEDGWGLLVQDVDYLAARKLLRGWKDENRVWNWRRKIVGPDFFFHWGSLLWACGMLAMYYWSMVKYPWLQSAGAMNSKAFAAGQWWRLFTAVTLHGDLSHLISNLSTGLLLTGVAMARFGAGPALLAAFLAGAFGNLASIWFHSHVDQGLGASGMIMGALGLLSTQSFAFWQKYPPAARLALRTFAAGIMFFVLLGLSPGTDVTAHLGGFVGGAVLGVGLGVFDAAKLRHARVNSITMITLIIVIISTWWMATHNPNLAKDSPPQSSTKPMEYPGLHQGGRT